MARKNLIAGLDVGTTKTAVVIGELYRQSQVHVLGIGTARSQGLKGGQVVDIALTAQAIGEAVFRAERAAGERVDRVCVGVAGGHLRSHTRRAEMYLRSGGNQVGSRGQAEEKSRAGSDEVKSPGSFHPQFVLEKTSCGGK